ncbi:mitochondrial fission ELM1 family protein [Sphingomonas daechungensis]|uniref:Mitochondrial fission ELM1 family protein n=1 Tax=Sphingomonas daechungensis TaxID=1176646 RepID=A0ABX6SZJ1_9SPHN|nr:mitochondrial fission ELM1 family protein [Sphingomonas daechungensis]
MEPTPRIWVLLGWRRGDNNQLLALAEALGLPFETRTLSYRRSWALLLNLLPKRPHLLTRRARHSFEPPWPDLVIGIGRRSVAVSRWIRKRSGKHTKIVRLGNPRRKIGCSTWSLRLPNIPLLMMRMSWSFRSPWVGMENRRNRRTRRASF